MRGEVFPHIYRALLYQVQITVQSTLYMCHSILSDDDDRHVHGTYSVPDPILISLPMFIHLNPYHRVCEVVLIMIFIL